MIPIAKPTIGPEEKNAVLDVLDSGMIAQGSKTKELEDAFANYIGTEHAIAVTSGTSALHCALLASGIKEGDEVITTPFSFTATANSILYCGAKPVFADIDPETFNIDPLKIEEQITSKTKAVLVVHLFGNPCDMDRIKEVCNKHKLSLIEDACQAHGAKYKGQKVGSIGDCGVFSLYPTKNMTTGEGGMITTNSPEIAKKCRIIRDHGQDGRDNQVLLGYNYRMTDIQAAIGVEQLKKLEGFIEKRINNANMLTEGLKDVKGIITPIIKKDTRHVFNQYTLRVTDEFKMSREELIQKLKDAGIGAFVYYPKPIYRQKYYQDSGYTDNCKNTENITKEVLSIPVHPNVTEDDVRKIIDTITKQAS
ncbi:MAG: aminotransferase class I/II-fold pyridoxal phosphate-dependent enzyme [Nanohaloarchaea archaeon]|nr:aminotransferase class I/II-fold pyridoxal phosphate-dependent enzyme [Candidatus Nanohaloarchaea archaeon]